MPNETRRAREGANREAPARPRGVRRAPRRPGNHSRRSIYQRCRLHCWVSVWDLWKRVGSSTDCRCAASYIRRTRASKIDMHPKGMNRQPAQRKDLLGCARHFTRERRSGVDGLQPGLVAITSTTPGVTIQASSVQSACIRARIRSPSRALTSPSAMSRSRPESANAAGQCQR